MRLQPALLFIAAITGLPVSDGKEKKKPNSFVPKYLIPANQFSEPFRQEDTSSFKSVVRQQLLVQNPGKRRKIVH